MDTLCSLATQTFVEAACWFRKGRGGSTSAFLGDLLKLHRQHYKLAPTSTLNTLWEPPQIAMFLSFPLETAQKGCPTFPPTSHTLMVVSRVVLLFTCLIALLDMYKAFRLCSVPFLLPSTLFQVTPYSTLPLFPCSFAFRPFDPYPVVPFSALAPTVSIVWAGCGLSYLRLGERHRGPLLSAARRGPQRRAVGRLARARASRRTCRESGGRSGLPRKNFQVLRSVLEGQGLVHCRKSANSQVRHLSRDVECERERSLARASRGWMRVKAEGLQSAFCGQRPLLAKLITEP